MALLIFAFVKNGYLLRLASTLQQNWPHSFRKMSFDVWRIFLYFSQISILACFASSKSVQEDHHTPLLNIEITQNFEGQKIGPWF